MVVGNGERKVANYVHQAIYITFVWCSCIKNSFRNNY